MKRFDMWAEVKGMIVGWPLNLMMCLVAGDTWIKAVVIASISAALAFLLIAWLRRLHGLPVWR